MSLPREKEEIVQVPGQGDPCETYGELLCKASLQRLRLAAFHSETKQDAANGKGGGGYEHKATRSLREGALPTDGGWQRSVIQSLTSGLTHTQTRIYIDTYMDLNMDIDMNMDVDIGMEHEEREYERELAIDERATYISTAGFNTFSS